MATIKMRMFRALLCIVLMAELGRADVLFEDMEVEVFDNRKTDFEANVLDSLKVTKNFFGSSIGKAALNAGAKVINFVPYVKQLSALLPKLGSLLAEQSDWKTTFIRALAEETNRAITLNEIVWIEATLQTIHGLIELLDERRQPDIERRKSNAQDILNFVDTMMNYFDHRAGLFKKYPLITSPLLISLIQVIALFTPLANTLIPIESKHMQLACKSRDVLMAYRSRSVYARSKQLNLEFLYNKYAMDVLRRPFNEYGYNETNPGTLRCDSGCEKPYPPTYCNSVCRQFRNERNCKRRQCNNYGLDQHSYCVIDAFGTNKYSHDNIINVKDPAKQSFPCVTDYVSLVRHRVEDMFPVALLNKMCDRRPRNLTGLGWLTIHLGLIQAYGDALKDKCDPAEAKECDPYVILIINGEQIHRSPSRTNTAIYDINYRYVSGKIPRNSNITVEVWDDDKFEGILSIFSSSDDLVLHSEGDIDDFLNNPFRTGVVTTGAQFNGQNSLSTYSFWEDEYDFLDEETALDASYRALNMLK